jgi:hypothetical protein
MSGLRMSELHQWHLVARRLMQAPLLPLDRRRLAPFYAQSTDVGRASRRTFSNDLAIRWPFFGTLLRSQLRSQPSIVVLQRSVIRWLKLRLPALADYALTIVRRGVDKEDIAM